MKSKEEIKQAKDEAEERLHCLYDKILALSICIVPSYDVIEDFFFQDIDFQRLQPNLPMWMADAGRSPESPCNRIYYDTLRKVFNDSLSNRILHWFDVQNLLAAFQDRICALVPYLEAIFKEIPAYCMYNDSEYTAASRKINPSTDRIHTSINNVFVSLASAFDLFTKVVYECAKYEPAGFTTYKRLKSRAYGILYDKKNFAFFLLMRKLLKGIATNRFIEFLDYRERLHGHVLCSDELEICGWYLNDREQFKEYADRESLINMTPNMGTIFDAYYRVGLGFKNEFDMVHKRHYQLPDYPRQFALKEITGEDLSKDE